MKKIFCALLILLIIVVVKTITDNTIYSQKNYTFSENTSLPSQKAVERFSGGLKIKTISNSDYSKTNFTAFDEFIEYIKQTYPLIFKKCEYTQVNKYGLIIKYKGKNSNELPNLLSAHYDVVNIKNEKDWQYPPFSGYYDAEYIYSRGTIDDKGAVFGILEALNELLLNNYEPKSDLYVALSPSEETGAEEGTPKIIEYFKQKKIFFNTALDEGGRIVNKNGKYYAFIGTAEKGRLLSKITVFGQDSHASMPDKNLATQKLAKLILAFNSNNPKAIMSRDIYEYYIKTYDSYPLFIKVMISNKYIFAPILFKFLSKNPEDNARLHSTNAITVIEASNVANAITKDASMLIDTRILPSQSSEDIKQYLVKTIKNTLPNEQFKIEYLSIMEPCKSSDINSKEYHQLVKNIRKLYPDIIVAPYLTLGATDAREYSAISKNTYRFLPCILTVDEASLMHSDNEKLSLRNWGRMITFYKEFITDR